MDHSRSDQMSQPISLTSRAFSENLSPIDLTQPIKLVFIGGLINKGFRLGIVRRITLVDHSRSDEKMKRGYPPGHP